MGEHSNFSEIPDSFKIAKNQVIFYKIALIFKKFSKYYRFYNSKIRLSMRFLINFNNNQDFWNPYFRIGKYSQICLLIISINSMKQHQK